MPRWVLLQHTMPDGTWHHDLMIERSAPPVEPDSTHRLMSFRIDVGLVLGESFHAERIPDHRAAYLDYEGTVSRRRGSVNRLAAGHGQIILDSPAQITIQLSLARRTIRYRGQPDARGQKWTMLASEPGSW